MQETATKTDQEIIDEKVKRDIERLEARRTAIKDRLAQMDVIHQDIVAIYRLDDIAVQTFLDIADQAISQRRRTSWHGEILEISSTDSGDDVIEAKKKKLKVGDIINFNPESCYCLNVADYDEIWILHVDNILYRDNGYNYMRSREVNLRKKFEIQQAADTQRMKMAEAASNVQKINSINKKR